MEYRSTVADLSNESESPRLDEDKAEAVLYLSPEPVVSTTSEPIDFARPHLTAADIRAAVETLETGWITTGSVCQAFEEELASYLGVKHVVAVSSATTAEEICLAGLGEPKGRRIGVPAWTFASSALAIHRTGHVPVLLDVDHSDLNVSASSLKEAITDGGLDGSGGRSLRRKCRQQRDPRDLC